MDEEEQQTEHQSTCTPCQHSFQGYEKVAQSMQAIARLLDDKALSLTNTFTEHLHYHRHLFASFEDMLDRKDQLLEAITDNQLTIPRSVAAQIISANRRSPSSPQLSPTLIYQHRRQLSNEQVDIILQRVNICFLSCIFILIQFVCLGSHSRVSPPTSHAIRPLLFSIRIDLFAQTAGIHISDVPRFSTATT